MQKLLVATTLSPSCEERELHVSMVDSLQRTNAADIIIIVVMALVRNSK